MYDLPGQIKQPPKGGGVKSGRVGGGGGGRGRGRSGEGGWCTGAPEVV